MVTIKKLAARTCVFSPNELQIMNSMHVRTSNYHLAVDYRKDDIMRFARQLLSKLPR